MEESTEYRDALSAYLAEAGITRLVPFYGTDPNATAEQRAKALLESLQRIIEDGDFAKYNDID